MLLNIAVGVGTVLVLLNLLLQNSLAKQKQFFANQEHARAAIGLSAGKRNDEAEDRGKKEGAPVARDPVDLVAQSRRAAVLHASSFVALVLLFAFLVGRISRAPHSVTGDTPDVAEHSQEMRVNVRKTAGSDIEREHIMVPLRRLVEQGYVLAAPQIVTDAKLIMLLYNTSTHPEDADVNYQVDAVTDSLILGHNGTSVRSVSEFAITAAGNWESDKDAGWFKKKESICTACMTPQEFSDHVSVSCFDAMREGWTAIPSEYLKIGAFRTGARETNDFWVQVNVPRAMARTGAPKWDGHARLRIVINSECPRQPSLYFFECQRFLRGVRVLHSVIQSTLTDSTKLDPRVFVGFPFTNHSAKYDVRTTWNSNRSALDFSCDIQMAPGQGQSAVAFNFMPGASLLATVNVTPDPAAH
jgi:hypothetical protein